MSLEISFYQASQSQHKVRLSKLLLFYFFHTPLIMSFQCRYHICSICYRGTQEHGGGRSCWQRHSRQRQWQPARQLGRTRGVGVEFDSAFAKSTVAGFLRPLLKALLCPSPQFRPPPIGVGGRLRVLVVVFGCSVTQRSYLSLESQSAGKLWHLAARSMCKLRSFCLQRYFPHNRRRERFIFLHYRWMQNCC